MIEGLLARLKGGGDQICYQDGAHALTYAECYERVYTLAQALRRQGNGPVAVYGHKCAMQFVSILACVAARRCYIPLDTHMPRKRIEEILAQAGAELVLTNAPLDVPGVACFPPGSAGAGVPGGGGCFIRRKMSARTLFSRAVRREKARACRSLMKICHILFRGSRRRRIWRLFTARGCLACRGSVLISV